MKLLYRQRIFHAALEKKRQLGVGLYSTWVPASDQSAALFCSKNSLYWYQDHRDGLKRCTSYVQGGPRQWHCYEDAGRSTEWSLEIGHHTKTGWISCEWRSCCSDVCRLVRKDMYREVSCSILYYKHGILKRLNAFSHSESILSREVYTVFPIADGSQRIQLWPSKDPKRRDWRGNPGSKHRWFSQRYHSILSHLSPHVTARPIHSTISRTQQRCGRTISQVHL